MIEISGPSAAQQEYRNRNEYAYALHRRTRAF
jgi:hypothetical protein